MSTHKLFVLAIALAGCTPRLSAADLDEAQKASDAVCACTHIPIDGYGACAAEAYPKWQAIDQKLHDVAPLDRLEPHSRETLVAIETAVGACKGKGDEAWNFVRRLKEQAAHGANAASAAPAPINPGK